MRLYPLAFLPVSLVLLALPAGAFDSPPRPATVALVCRIAGSATFRPASGAPPAPLALLQRLVPGDTLATARGAAVTVVFLDGQRQVLLGGARARVRTAGLDAAPGRIRRLATVRVIVDLAPLLQDDPARSVTPAGLIRGGGGAAADWRIREAREALALEADRLGEPDLRLLLTEVDRLLGPEPRP